MFEAKLTEGVVLKKIVESIKDIVTDVNIDISPSGMIKPSLNFSYRYLPPSYGQLSCSTSFPQSLHGRI